MGFEPLKIVRPTRAVQELTYRVVLRKDRLNLVISMHSSLADRVVRGQCRVWRLDIDKAERRGRLTGMIASDGNQATRVPQTKRNFSRLIWGLCDEAAAMWPKVGNHGPLTKITVTSMGIEFDLP